VSITDELLANNARYTATFTGPLPLPPAKHVAVVACMNARLDIYRILASTRAKPTSSATPAA
jgi:carbonic anhydrase